MKDMLLVDELNSVSGLRHLLYRRGYLITNRNDLKLDEYPFYKNWIRYEINERYTAIVHNEQHFFKVSVGKDTIIMIGHAYNPFNMVFDEQILLETCLRAYQNDRDSFFNEVSELTGIHIIGVFTSDKQEFVQDCTAMKALYYGCCGEDSIYITSHCSLIEDIDTPTENKFVEKLTASYCYNHWGTKYLPGDVTVFNEFRRLGPNVSLTFENERWKIRRFFPIQNHPEKREDDKETIKEIADLLKRSVSLCAKKWDKPAVSLSGGMDSRTTLAAANGNYEKFQFYSFYCKPQELDDANAAHEICSILGVPHRIYPIENENSAFENFELYKRIIARNNAYVTVPKEHEIRKYIFLSSLNDFDCELKSWASEIGRAYWERRYGIPLPNELKPRDFSIFQTRFLGAPLLMNKNDKAYKEYLQKSGFVHPMYNYEDTDLFYWEYRFGSNGTNVTMGQDIFNFEVTMPMNNRKLMDMFLWYPHEMRKNDQVHNQTIITNEPKLDNIGKDVHNGYFAGNRIRAERLYYRFRRLL